MVVVASQCLESAYGISIRDVEAAALLRLPSSLPEIFSSGLMQLVCFIDNCLYVAAAATCKNTGNKSSGAER